MSRMGVTRGTPSYARLRMQDRVLLAQGREAEVFVQLTGFAVCLVHETNDLGDLEMHKRILKRCLEIGS